MKIKLEFKKNGTNLYLGIHEIENAEDFGRAFAAAWQELHRAQLDHEFECGGPDGAHKRKRARTIGRRLHNCHKDLSGLRRPTLGQPLIQINGRKRATRRARPACSAAATTVPTSS